MFLVYVVVHDVVDIGVGVDVYVVVDVVGHAVVYDVVDIRV